MKFESPGIPLSGETGLGGRERFALSWSMLVHQPARFLGSTLGVTTGFFLAAAQFGLLVGWINTNTALIRHAGADLWVMAPRTAAYDYGTAIPEQLLFRLRSLPGIERTESLFVAWNVWQQDDGRQINVEMVGLDDASFGGPWQMREGTVDCVHREDTVIVDELYLEDLGVRSVGDEFEILGRRVRVGGISEGVRTFTASPFIFTSLPNALNYDRRYRKDEITYVLGWCEEGTDVQQIATNARQHLPEVEVLTTHEFAARSARYWMLETGVGLTVIFTAILGLAIGTLIVSQTLFSLLHDHLPHYATLLAIGFEGRALGSIVTYQGLILGLLGSALGSLAFAAAAWSSARSPIPLETTPTVFCCLVIASLAACLLASRLAVRRLFKIDPVTVFNA